jgi:L-ascorbate metabolism protein UlaG (beta-lactamase superfamily)
VRQGTGRLNRAPRTVSRIAGLLRGAGDFLRGAAALLCVASLALAPAAGAGPLAKPDPVRFPVPTHDTVTFWGHACCYIDLDGFGIVTDPVFDNDPFLRDRKIPAPPPAAYAATRIILISHAHDDHLSPATIATFPDSCTVLCPVPSAQYLTECRQPVRTMRPGDSIDFAAGRITAVAAHHPGTRWSIDAAADGRALGWVIETVRTTIYYTGDTDLFPGIGVVGAKYAPDIVILSCSGHLEGEDAVVAARGSGAPIVIPVHWGAYGFLFVHERRVPRNNDRLQRELGSTLVTLPVGGSLPLPAERRRQPRRRPDRRHVRPRRRRRVSAAGVGSNAPSGTRGAARRIRAS